MSAAVNFRAALAAERPLQIVGAVNAYTAMLAEKAGFKAIYLSGAGVANASFGLPDLAMTTLNDRERYILTKRRLSEDPTTLEDLSQEYGISRERVRQIEVRAFEKLQKAIRNAALEQKLAQD